MAEAIIKISHLFPLPPVSIADAHKPEAGEQAQQRVVPIFHYALNPGGILWLGPSESIREFSNLFELEDCVHKFHYKKTVAIPMRFQFPTGRKLRVG
jgi:hypothetical protein